MARGGFAPTACGGADCTGRDAGGVDQARGAFDASTPAIAVPLARGVQGAGDVVIARNSGFAAAEICTKSTVTGCA